MFSRTAATVSHVFIPAVCAANTLSIGLISACNHPLHCLLPTPTVI